jgi:hypothetical protein
MSCVQSTLATARHASQYPIRGLGPDKRLGVFIGNVQASVDGRFRFSAAIPTPSFQDDHCLVYRQNGPDWPFRHAGARGLIDTRRGSHRGHYVNRSVRGIRPPAGWRFSPPRFEPSRLRMRCIIHPRVVVPAIQSAPVATHSVATIAAPGIQPCGDRSDTGLRPAPAPFARVLSPAPAGSYSQ